MKFPLDSTDLSPGTENRTRFEREVRCQSSLRHPGVMPIIAINLRAANPFYVMPIARYSLGYLLESRRIDPEETVEIVTEVMNALAYAHAEGIIHRDLKPENVLFLENRWVVSDFGLCRDINSDSLTITRTETVFGSLAYMAPEQFDDAHNATVAADIYAVGQILYHCLVGEIPYPRARIAKVPAQFKYVVSKCVTEEPDDRFQSVADLRRALEVATAPSDELAVPTQRAKDLRESAREGSPGAVRDLLRFLCDRSDDEIFYKEFLPSISLPLMRAMAAEDSAAFRHVVLAFDKYAEGGHPFSYTDELATFFRNAWRATEDPLIRQACLKRVFRIGVDHNRFYVGDMFGQMVREVSLANDVQYVVGLLAEDIGGARFAAPYLNQYAIPDAIRRVIPAI